MTKVRKKAARGLAVDGFRAAGIAAGIKKNGKLDLAIIMGDAPLAAAALFTTNRVKAAPVVLSMARAKKGELRGVVVNSGNANACTGKAGMEAARRMARAAEKATASPAGSFLVCSTGVIGVPMPVERAEAKMPALAKALSPSGLKAAAEAIMTTDAFMKASSAAGVIAGKKVTVAGIAKGAGMICPDMATMLAFVMTDAEISGAQLRAVLREAADASFNAISVDNDTSTNDTVVLMASGASGARVAGPEALEKFTSLVARVCGELARMIVADGEGATRVVEIMITGAASNKDAWKAARTVANSFLVKTAFFGGDPNWGRILAAIGRAGIRFREASVGISFNGVPVVKNGLDTGNEKKAARAMKKKEVRVDIVLGSGRGSCRFLTSDLTYEYVRINSAYRT